MVMSLEQVRASVVIQTSPVSAAFQQVLLDAIDTLYSSSTGRSLLIRAARSGLLVFTNDENVETQADGGIININIGRLEGAYWFNDTGTLVRQLCT